MKKNILIASVIVIAVIIVAVLLFWIPSETIPVATEGVGEVIIKDSVFNPAIINISKGTKVTWKNMDSAVHQIVSDPHPGHTDLPGLSSKALSYGESYSYTFDKEGVFGYHCDQNPAMEAHVIVK